MTKTRHGQSTAIPCVVSGMQVEDLLDIIEPACDEAPALTWFQDCRVKLSSVSLTLRHRSILIIESHDDRALQNRPARIRLHRIKDPFTNQSPSAFLRSWRNSLRGAVYDHSQEAGVLIGSLAKAARHLAAAATASGVCNADALGWSSRGLSSSSRFQIRGTDHRLCATPKISGYLEGIAPSFRYIGAVAPCFPLGVTSTLKAYKASACSIELVEMMRLIADLPAEAIDELAASHSHL